LASESATSRWKAHPGPQTAFLQTGAKSAYECLFGGSKGPGKTDCLIMEATRQVRNARYHGLLLRRTYPQLQEIIDRTQRWYPSIGGHWESQRHRWVFGTGAMITLGHCQYEASKYNYQGHEYHYIGFDQLEQFTETQYLYLLAQQRTTVPELCCYVRATANPGGIGHGWVRRRFVDLRPSEVYHDSESHTTRMFIPSTLEDNPSLMEVDPGYEDRLRLGGETQYRAFRHGDWDSFAGQYFTGWKRDVHVVEPYALPDTWQRFISMDYGYASPSAVYWWGVDYDDRMIGYRELYVERLTYTDLAHEIQRRTPCKVERIKYLTADPAIWSDISHHRGDLRGETGYEMMQRVFDAHVSRCGCSGIRVIKADNDRVNGWIRLRERIAAVKVQVFANCTNLVRTLPEQIHDERDTEDLDTTGEDHAVDSVRYACMSRPVSSERPVVVKSGTERFWEQVRRENARRVRVMTDDDFLSTFR
jgi:hypothetical protein